MTHFALIFLRHDCLEKSCCDKPSIDLTGMRQHAIDTVYGKRISDQVTSQAFTDADINQRNLNIDFIEKSCTIMVEEIKKFNEQKKY